MVSNNTFKIGEESYSMADDQAIIEHSVEEMEIEELTQSLAKAVSFMGANYVNDGAVIDVCYLIESLILKGADVSYVYPDNLSLVGRAARNGEQKICTVLLRLGATWGAGCDNRAMQSMKIALEYAPAALMMAYRYGENKVISTELHQRFVDETGLKTDSFQMMVEKISEYVNSKKGLFNVATHKHALEDLDANDADLSFDLFDQDALMTAIENESGKSREFMRSIYKAGSKRKFSVVDTTSISEKMNALRDRFPNFSETIDFLMRSIMLSSLSKDKRFEMMPVLLVGSPGIGKTKFLHSFASVINAEFKMIGCGSVTAGWVLGGSSTSWSEGKMGMVVTALRDGKTANPILMLDEIDKLAGDSRHDGFGPLYSLMEKNTAKSFIDEAIGFPLNCSKINWVCTANDIKSIPEPILSRLTVIKVPDPTKEQMRSILKSVYVDILVDNQDSFGDRFNQSINDDLIDHLINLSPREMKAKIMEAMGNAACSRQENIYSLNVDDFKLTDKLSKPSIGFLGR